MSYRTTCVNNAVSSIHEAITAIKQGFPECAVIYLNGALRSLHHGLDIGPSEKAIEEIVSKEEAA